MLSGRKYKSSADGELKIEVQERRVANRLDGGGQNMDRTGLEEKSGRIEKLYN